MASLSNGPLAWPWWARGSSRPAPTQQPSLLPFDPDDAGGVVHTTLPPEFNQASSPYFLTADFNGVTLPGAWKWIGPPAAPGSSVVIQDGPYVGLTIPFFRGANSTPPTMIMTPMLILYPRKVQDAVLREHALRGYQDVVIAPDGWNLTDNGFFMTGSVLAAWAQYIQSWGFRVVLWSSTPVVGDPWFRTLLAAHGVDFFIPGEEIAGKIRAEDVDPVVQQAAKDCGRGIPIGLHIYPNYPIDFPADTFVTDWSPYNDLNVHLMWEGGNKTRSTTFADPAGTMGALLFYARMRVKLGWVGEGTYSHPAPNCRVYPFELMATSQLMGQSDEITGKRRSWELLCCPNGGNPAIDMLHGAGNGLSQPDGWYLGH